MDVKRRAKWTSSFWKVDPGVEATALDLIDDEKKGHEKLTDFESAQVC